MRYIVAFLSSALIFLVIVLGDRSNAYPVPQYGGTSDRCTAPIARILSTTSPSPSAKPGGLICSGDTPRITAPINVLCFSTGEVVRLSSPDLKLCPSNIASSVRSCSTADGSNCPKPKGGMGDATAPIIFRPYSSSVLDDRPSISWSQVQGTTYTVQVTGAGVAWRENSLKTTMDYPDNKPGMSYGNAYKISVIAKKDDNPISSAETVVSLVDIKTAENVRDAIRQVRALNLPKDESTLLDIDSIYAAHNLLTERIDNLVGRISAGSQNPRIFRLLGDCFLEADLPDSAKSNYLTAEKLARKIDDRDELEKILQGLQSVRVTRS